MDIINDSQYLPAVKTKDDLPIVIPGKNMYFCHVIDACATYYIGPGMTDWDFMQAVQPRAVDITLGWLEHLYELLKVAYLSQHNKDCVALGEAMDLINKEIRNAEQK
jgi:hypothetical protein